MGNLLSYVLTCDWVDVEQEEGVSTEGKTTPVPCMVAETFKAAEPGMGKSQEISVELAAKEADWIHRTGNRDRDLWFCPQHGPSIKASGL